MHKYYHRRQSRIDGAHVRIIKKYKNRILYDTEISKSVTLKHIAEMLKNNIKIKILDNTSGKDITRMTIIQMLLTMERSDRGITHLIPEIISWVAKTTKQEFRKILNDIMNGNNPDMDFGYAWAKRLIQDVIDPDLSEEKENLLIEQIVSRLDEFRDATYMAIENKTDEILHSFARLILEYRDVPIKKIT